MDILKCLVFCNLLYGSNCLLLDENLRKVDKTLTVSNGDAFGAWTTMELCPPESFAIGYDMKIEPDQHSGDDTALNSIKLICGSKDGHYGSTVTSGEGSWGSWVGSTMCSYSTNQTYLTSFALQVELLQPGDRDDVAATYVKFWCSDLDIKDEHKIAHPPGHGLLGVYGNQSEKCNPGSAICGLQTNIEAPIFFGDDTALNNVRFFCCPYNNDKI
ncbi:vitelline membrane outer layer protein 1-like isoform X1 [Mytilus galloprovincialis]|uniref:vitelline membrane outer layer protein 1-like isoform X1 n=1 Tax=Mytilus galloprovincialis TaxID=29158 RepID=UPI003F7B73F9